MSRKISKEIADAFLSGIKKSISNSRTDGDNLFLHGNKIAKIEKGTLYVSTAGWGTPTTKERLNALPNVRVSTKNYQLYLNGEKWDGSWKAVAKITRR